MWLHLLLLALAAALPLYEWKALSNSTGYVPTSRSTHSTSVIGRRLYIFGGCDKHLKCFNDLHIYDSQADEWTRLNSTGSVPSPRGGHVAGSFGSKILLFGGGQQGSKFNDLYEYDGIEDHWTQLLPTGDLPSARVNAAGDLNEDGNLVVVGGYTDDGYENDVWVYDYAANTWAKQTPSGDPPSAREYHSVTILNRQAFVYGGFHEGGVSSTLYSLDLDSMRWRQPFTDGKRPEGREGHSAVRQGTYLHIFSGCDYSFKDCYEDFYTLDLTTMWWTKVDASSFTGREASNAAAIGPIIYNYGGCEMRNDCYDQLYQLNTGISCPKNCTGHGICRNDVCVCSDGYSGSDCRVRAQCTDDCNQQGYCSASGECDCYSGYKGTTCNSYVGCSNNCTDSTHGTCLASGSCSCADGYQGDDCSSSTTTTQTDFLQTAREHTTPSGDRRVIRLRNRLFRLSGESLRLGSNGLN